MNILKKIQIVILSLILISCASNTPPPKTFNEFLYNKASMTKQLESLDELEVRLLFSGVDGSNFKRIASLNLRDKPVIVGVSQTKLANSYFTDLLKNADTMPIGKVLFAKNSPVKRDTSMPVDEMHLNDISDKMVRDYITTLGYTNDDIIYKRTSIFRNGKQYMQVIEYILPSIHNWLSN